MKKTKPFITGQQHIQGINRKFLSLMILAFILTASFFSTVAVGHGTRLKGEPIISNYGSQGKSQALYYNNQGLTPILYPDPFPAFVCFFTIRISLRS